jgi:deoxyribodipyrimidine photolyase-related protein
MKIRNLILILGDQLDAQSAALQDFDPQQDAVFMAEVAHESTKVWSTKPRTAMFLTAMRHFREELRSRGYRVFYRELTADAGHWTGADSRRRKSQAETFREALAECVHSAKPQQLIMVQPGEWSVQQDCMQTAAELQVSLQMREDTHFLCSNAEFLLHTQGRKQLRMEYFYREMRVRHHVLMQQGKPVGGEWNYDAENRKSFGKEGPPLHTAPVSFTPDALTQEVITLVNARFATHPGDLSRFDWPVTAADAERALADFILHRLAQFGDWQDAMWTEEPWLFHSRLSAAMNLKLLNPRQVIAAAETAYHQGTAPLAAVEGFIRQILGWREYVRGIYWKFMPQYVELNALQAKEPLPAFFWTAETAMQCLRQTLTQTLHYGYAHHIQRLMVTGLYTLMLGANPRAVHEWYLAVYVDAIEWVELPNTLGMSQHGDGGIMASKPYIATGKYIQRMSNYCSNCKYDPAQSTGERACPFTTLYWDFLHKHEARLRKNPRMSMQMRNLDRLSPQQKAEISVTAEHHKRSVRAIKQG